jgi:hypothetical protein
MLSPMLNSGFSFFGINISLISAIILLMTFS